MPRKWRGKSPENYESVLAEAPAWTLYLLNRSGNWLNLKLVAKNEEPNKANYTLGYNPKEDRFAKTKDLVLLQAHRHDLAGWVEHALRPGASPPEQPQEPAAPDPAPMAPAPGPEPAQDRSGPERAQAFARIVRRLMEETDTPLTEEVPPALHQKALTEFNAEYGGQPLNMVSHGVVRVGETGYYLTLKEPENDR